MRGLDSEQFQSSLRDVIDWCAARHSDVVFDSAEAANRRKLCDLADRLIEEARNTPIAQKSEQWNQAQILYDQIRESFSSLKVRFRSPSLMPTRTIEELKTDSDWLEAMSEVASKRNAQNKQNPQAQDHRVSADSGRLLVYFPHQNLACGAAEFSSNGFYDCDNVPPWDLWISFSDGALVSWVPLGLIEAAQMGSTRILSSASSGCVGEQIACNPSPETCNLPMTFVPSPPPNLLALISSRSLS